MRLTVVVPATDAPVTLGRCAAAIGRADEPPEELITVETATRPGPAAARNEGAARASGDVLVFVDSDVLVGRDAFVRIRRAFAGDPALAAVFGSYDDAPEAPGTVSRFRNLLHHHVHQEGAGPASTFWSGLGAVRRDVFEGAGGFDALRYPHASIEDIELGVRLSASGARIRLDPAIQGTHLKAWTLRGMLRTDIRRRGIPWVALMLRTGAGSSTLNLGWRNRLSVLAALATVLSLGRRRPAAAVGAGSAIVLLNRGFYGLLLRRLGPFRAATAVFPHTLHLLAAAASVPLGAVSYLRDREATKRRL